MIHFYRISDAMLWKIDEGETDLSDFMSRVDEFTQRVFQHYKLSNTEHTRINSLYVTISQMIEQNEIQVKDKRNPLNLYFDEISNILQEADTDFFD
jgi:hypothetical protein